MRKIAAVGLCMAVLLVAFSFDMVRAAQVTLRFSDWHLTEDVWNKSLNEGMDIFHKRHPNIKVTLEPVSYGEKETKYTVESAAGRAPDVFHVHAFSLPMFFGKGYAKDLTPLVESSLIDDTDVVVSHPRGEVAEWLKAAASKAVVRVISYRGFESHPLRHSLPSFFLKDLRRMGGVDLGCFRAFAECMMAPVPD